PVRRNGGRRAADRPRPVERPGHRRHAPRRRRLPRSHGGRPPQRPGPAEPLTVPLIPANAGTRDFRRRRTAAASPPPRSGGGGPSAEEPMAGGAGHGAPPFPIAVALALVSRIPRRPLVSAAVR